MTISGAWITLALRRPSKGTKTRRRSHRHSGPRAGNQGPWPWIPAFTGMTISGAWITLALRRPSKGTKTRRRSHRHSGPRAGNQGPWPWIPAFTGMAMSGAGMTATQRTPHAARPSPTASSRSPLTVPAMWSTRSSTSSIVPDRSSAVTSRRLPECRTRYVAVSASPSA